MLNPINNHFPEEMAALGRMVLGYSELDFTLCHAVGLALNDKWTVMNALHSLKQEAARLDIIEHLARGSFEKLGILPEFTESIFAMRYCRARRNTYAHATWIIENREMPNPKFRFTDLTEAVWPTKLKTKVLDLPLIKLQEAYFDYTKACVLFLEAKADPVRAPFLKMPTKIQPPKPHIDA